MVTATLTSKGQITIPKTIRERMHLHSGDLVAFVVQGETETLMRPVTKTVDQVFGRLGKPGQTGKTVAEMNRAIALRMKDARS